MKTAGILGGMGPGTTADFYKEINQLSEIRGFEDRPELLVWNVPLNYQLEQNLLLTQKGIADYIPYLQRGARILESGSADFGVVPCNTVHEIFNEFTSVVDMPFLHIVEETANRLESEGVEKVGLLATGQTIGSQLYQGFLNRRGIETVIPDQTAQDRLNTIVANLVTGQGEQAGRAGSNPDGIWINDLVQRYAQEVGSVVLGCTDFHILLNESSKQASIDSMQVLAEATVSKIYE